MNLGAHISIAGGIENSVTRGDKIGCNAIQIFTKSSHSWNASLLADRNISVFRENLINSSIRETAAHASYLPNIASPDNSLYNKSITALSIELDRSERLGIPLFVFHPGSHKGKGADYGIKRAGEALNILIEKTKGYKVALVIETTAGQGSSTGCSFDHIRDIISLVDSKGRLGICIDTCHIFAAGYDIRDKTAYNNTFDELDNKIGLDMIRLFHLNDSKRGLKSKVDRHEHIGKGFLGIKPFSLILNDERFRHIPMIIETPKTDERADRDNLDILTALIKTESKNQSEETS